METEKGNKKWEKILGLIKWDEKGLVPVITQDEKTKKVLMMAYMDKVAFEFTIRTGLVHYYSRSKGKIWKKGEESGHIQKVKSIHLDCDGDSLLILVDQNVAACHTGYFSCFYRVLKEDGWIEEGRKVFDEKEVYGKK